MKRSLITIILLIFGLNLFPQGNIKLSENEKVKIIEEVACFTECTDFIISVDACVSLMRLSFKSENLDLYVHDYNQFSPSRVDISNPELLCVICNWKSRKIEPLDTEHAKVTGRVSYCITDTFGRSCDGKIGISCEVCKTKEGWNISTMDELLVLNDTPSADMY